MSIDLYNDTYDLLCGLVCKPNATILEIGCGPGNITKYLLSKRPDFRIEAIDVSPDMIVLAKQNCPTVHFTVMDGRNIDKLNQKYDAIVNGFCIPYLSPRDCLKLFADCNNLLNDKGLLYLSFVEGYASQSGYQTASSGDRAYFYYHSPEQINSTLKKNDFNILNVEYKSYRKSDDAIEKHTILIAKKQVNA